ncbi:MAG TPA: S-layer protein [Cyanobacteria bacterium UBA11049]|nr:S-layer protein [Cyanobacteria bacterium UBA11049]
MLKSLKNVAATTLVLAATTSYPVRMVAQTPPVLSNTNTPSRCVSGYPNGTFSGDRPVTRYEFAAGLDTCLQGVEELIRTKRSNLATKAEFEALIKRQQELNQQLRELNGRVSNSPAVRSSSPPRR